MLDRDQIAKIEAFVKTYPVISAIYLFGSHESGHERKKSDVDLGILFNEDVDGFTRIDIETEISNLLKKEVDLIDMKRSSPFLRHQIYKYGRLIYKDKSDFPFLFRAQSINEYLDMDYIRRLRRAHLNG